MGSLPGPAGISSAAGLIALSCGGFSGRPGGLGEAASSPAGPGGAGAGAREVSARVRSRMPRGRSPGELQEGPRGARAAVPRGRSGRRAPCAHTCRAVCPRSGIAPAGGAARSCSAACPAIAEHQQLSGFFLLRYTPPLHPPPFPGACCCCCCGCSRARTREERVCPLHAQWRPPPNPPHPPMRVSSSRQ